MTSTSEPDKRIDLRYRRCAVVCLFLAVILGCAEVSKITGSTWHEKYRWRAAEFFDDPQVISLCAAIEANDLAEMDRLIAAGANINAQGKGKMTPLLWAFPDNKLARFRRLLECGANPNVIFQSDFNTRGAIMPGNSVTVMATKTSFQGYFDAVFAHGGDVNIMDEALGGMRDTPIFTVIKSGSGERMHKIQFLLGKGADINHMNGGWATPVMQAVSWGGQYDIALMLLKAGADHKAYVPESNSRLIHQVLAEERRSATWMPQQRADYKALLQWLVDHGESLEGAKADRERWKSWSITTGEYRRKMDAEIAQRKAREAREKRAAEEKPND